VCAVLILLKLEKFFHCEGIACSIGKDRVHISYDLFEYLEVKIKSQKVWSLIFLMANFSEAERLCFYGGAFSARFPKWLIHNVYNLSTRHNTACVMPRHEGRV
jgi:hypothetical protein